MTSLLNIAGNIPVSGVEEGQSLRFEDGDSAYLSFTPASASNRKTWTWSGWVKRGYLEANFQVVFGAYDNSTQSNNVYTSIGFNSLGELRFAGWTQTWRGTSQVFRDPSAWYHIVVALDTTQATASDRVKIYVNGSEITAFGISNNPSLNANLGINATNQHGLGRVNYLTGSGPYYFDGYLANVAFIDGTALDPTSFGEYDDTLWKPKSDTDIQALTFGTNGWYLPFKQTTQSEGFSTVTYTGTSSQQAIEGVGFEPDFVWIKARSSSGYDHVLQDSVRGSTKQIYSNSTSSEVDDTDAVTSFDSSGFTTGADVTTNNSGVNYVAWCWDAGTGSAVSNTDGSITSSVKANTTNGFSIVSFVGNATAGATAGHGLSSTPEMLILKNRDSSSEFWTVFHTDVGNTKSLFLNSTGATDTSSAYWNNTSPTSSVFSLGGNPVNNGSGNDIICYAFHSVSGYSDIGSYSGTGASGNAVTTGFKPAFVMMKRTDASGYNWVIVDSTRDVSDPRVTQLSANSSAAENTLYADLDFTSTGFTIDTTDGAYNASGGTYIYMAFADTRDATFFGDTSGNSNNWTPNALNNTDVVPDSPVSGGNFAVLNPLDRTSSSVITLSEGNLRYTQNNGNFYFCGTTFNIPQSGKWYAEARVEATIVAGFGGMCFGFSLAGTYNYPTTGFGNTGNSTFVYNTNNTSSNTIRINSTNGGGAQNIAGGTAGDIVQFAFDADTGKCWFGSNGTWYGGNTGVPTAITLANLEAGSSPIDTFTAAQIQQGVTIMLGMADQQKAGGWRFNAGADSSFQGLETPQGNTDDNEQGDFYYAPPSGYLALKTSNLPTATITAPDEYFNTVLYTGTGASNSITVGFQPDWVWAKRRSAAASHGLVDSVRGAGQTLFSNLTDDEDTGDSNLTSFDTNGFTAGTGGNFNTSGQTYVAWNWLAGGTAVSNTDGSITSSVSANTDAGFSIVSYTGNGVNSTVGHGLSSAPEMVIAKWRTGGTAQGWPVYHSSIGNTKYLALNLTDAESTNSTLWNNTSPTSTNFSIGTNTWVNGSSSTYISYCFHSVESYSKIGSYTGNGSTDGTFVHCGFRPAWVMLKITTAAENWVIFDNERSEYNLSQLGLYPNTSGAEVTISTNGIDMLSNGFKLKGTGSRTNGSGRGYIFLAFAEAPFKSANAR